jgi:hypothetical protein
VTGAKAMAYPTDLPLVNIADSVQDVLWLAFGAFLIWIFIHRRRDENGANGTPQNTPSSMDDTEVLATRRNWIFGIVLVFNIIGSAAPLILNDYSAGFTLINALNTVDAIFTIAFIYIALCLFKGNKSVLPLFFYTAILYALLEGGDYILRHHWFSALFIVVWSGYFVYAIKAPLNRKTFRIANFIILPTLIAMVVAGQYLDTGNIIPLQQKEALLEQQFANDNSTLASYYGIFLQDQHPTASEIQDVLDAKTERDKRIQDVAANVNALQIEFEKEDPSIPQRKTLEGYRFFLELNDLNKQQGDKLEEFMNYASGVDFNKLTPQQVSDISGYKKQVQDFQDQLTQVQSQWSNANLN